MVCLAHHVTSSACAALRDTPWALPADVITNCALAVVPSILARSCDGNPCLADCFHCVGSRHFSGPEMLFVPVSSHWQLVVRCAVLELRRHHPQAGRLVGGPWPHAALFVVQLRWILGHQAAKEMIGNCSTTGALSLSAYSKVPPVRQPRVRRIEPGGNPCCARRCHWMFAGYSLKHLRHDQTAYCINTVG